MSLMDDLYPYTPPEPQAWEAIIATTATSDGQPVRVKIPSIDGGQHSWGPCNWPPHPAGRPAAGDQAIVAFTQSNTPVILEWW